jgi:hypothetical protein
VWLEFKHLGLYGYELIWWKPVNSGEVMGAWSQAGGAWSQAACSSLLHLNF